MKERNAESMEVNIRNIKREDRRTQKRKNRKEKRIRADGRTQQ